MKQAAVAVILNFPSRVQLRENDAWSKLQLKHVYSTSQGEVTCVKRTQEAELRAPTVRAKGETGETVSSSRIR